LAFDVVADSGFGIDPKGWCRLKASAKRNQQILRDIACREAKLLCFGSFNSQDQIWFIEWLLNP
jgi:hypothetical protein